MTNNEIKRQKKLKKISKKFGIVGNSLYLCIRKEIERNTKNTQQYESY